MGRNIMKDEFLYKFRKEPREEFTNDLYERISKEAGNSVGANYLSQRLRWVILTLIVIVIGGCSYLVISPTARARVLDQIRQIAGVTYNETPRYPSLAPEELVPIQFHVVQLSEAQDSLPFQLSLPAWVPDGYSLLEDQVMYYSYDKESADISKAYNVYLNWTNNNKPGGMSNIVLVEQPIFRPDQYEDNMMPVGQDSLAEVKIGKVVGALIRGSWNTETKLWDTESGQIALRWTKGDMHFLLTSNERYIELEDLIKMAESIH
jgi:hypothetical protein